MLFGRYLHAIALWMLASSRVSILQYRNGLAGGWVPKAGLQLAAADSQGSRTCVGANTFSSSGKGEITRPAVVPSSRAWQKPPVRRKGGRTWLPARVSGRHVVRGTDRPTPILEVRPGDRQGWWNRSKFRWDGRRSPWARPSALGCGDTLKAPASDRRLI